MTEVTSPEMFCRPLGPFTTKTHRWAFIVELVAELHVHLVELRAGRNPGVDGELFDAVENFMFAQAGQMKLEEPRMDQAQILALELAGVEIIDPPEPEDWYRDEDEDEDEDEDMDMDMDDYYPSIPKP